MAGQGKHEAVLKALRNTKSVFAKSPLPLPENEDEAAKLDLIDGGGAANKVIGALAGLDPHSIYRWKDKQGFSAEERRYIVIATGGHNLIAYYQRIALTSGLCATSEQLPACLAKVLVDASQVNALAVAALADGVLTAAERKAIGDAARQVQAGLSEIMATVEAGA